MLRYNIYYDSTEGFTDDRGHISDIFYNKNMNHACLIKSVPGAVRGNHFHKLTTQYTYVLEGEMIYYSKEPDGEVSKVRIGPGDVVVSPPMEVHAMKACESGCKFIAFAEGPRGGADYETDTFRVESICD